MFTDYSKEGFKKHLRDDPTIYPLFCKFANQAASVREYYSAMAIFQMMRWESTIVMKNKDFKIANNWCSHYARKFMRDHPKQKGFFRLLIHPFTFFPTEADEREAIANNIVHAERVKRQKGV
ncbi:MAG: hypothetical protein DRI46_09325 [Chloroflexi bacterium]|nr:MAG: hypothetical protein DRI46_09325 [Chloroflexota bacterium]